MVDEKFHEIHMYPPLKMIETLDCNILFIVIKRERERERAPILYKSNLYKM